MGPPISVLETRRRATTAWLVDAQADLASARSLSVHRDESTAPFAAAFHAQQAVEKAIKALLIWHAIAYPPRLDLGLLVGRLPDETSIKRLPVTGLMVYAVEQCYVAGAANPMSLIERPTWDEADDAIATAEEALAGAFADLARAGWKSTAD